MRPALVFLLASATPVLLFAQVPAGGEFRVSTAVQGQDGHTDVAARRDGAYVVAWSSTLADGSVFGVLARVYDAAGQPMGAAFLANTVTTGPQFFPAVAAAPKGGFLVVWEGSGSGPPGTFDDSGIFARAFDADGTPRAGQFMVNAYATGAQYFAHATAVGNAGFVVTWWSRHDNGTVGGFARRLRPDGQPLGAEFQVNSYTTGDQLVTGIAADPAGNFVVAWASPQDGSDYGVMARRYDGDAVPLGVEFQVNSQTTGVQWGPSVAIDGGGRFVVTWIGATAEDPVYGIRGQRFDAAGQRLGGEFRVNTYTTGFQTSGRVRSDESGNFTATWESLGQDGSSWGVYGQRFGASGQPRGAEFAVNTSTTGEQGLPHLASDPSGNVLVAWRSAHVDPVFDIYAQRFGGLQPAALDVNTFGNGIFEPGEVVDVAPSWRNVHGAALTFGGTAVSFTGPQPATYQIHTAFANYSLVPDGATRRCLDCYRVMVPTTTRPVLHWDAVFHERLTPDTLGQHKLWSLHLANSFVDVPPASGFYRFVETLLHHGITGGCSASEYCPASSTARDQMAVFTLVAKEGAGYRPPACGTPIFADVPAASPFCPFVEELARRGVVAGCGGGHYCPGLAVTREQMPVFVLRTLEPTLDPPACTTPVFADVPAASPYCRWIEELARRGVVTGCGGGNYCPADPVTREQMGVFIAATFGLSLYGP